MPLRAGSASLNPSRTIRLPSGVTAPHPSSRSGSAVPSRASPTDPPGAIPTGRGGAPGPRPAPAGEPPPAGGDPPEVDELHAVGRHDTPGSLGDLLVPFAVQDRTARERRRRRRQLLARAERPGEDTGAD